MLTQTCWYLITCVIAQEDGKLWWGTAALLQIQGFKQLSHGRLQVSLKSTISQSGNVTCTGLLMLALYKPNWKLVLSRSSVPVACFKDFTYQSSCNLTLEPEHRGQQTNFLWMLWVQAQRHSWHTLIQLFIYSCTKMWTNLPINSSSSFYNHHSWEHIKARTAPLRAVGVIKLDAKHQSFSKVVFVWISESNLDTSAPPSRWLTPQTETRIYTALTLVTAA